MQEPLLHLVLRVFSPPRNAAFFRNRQNSDLCGVMQGDGRLPGSEVVRVDQLKSSARELVPRQCETLNDVWLQGFQL